MNQNHFEAEDALAEMAPRERAQHAGFPPAPSRSVSSSEAEGRLLFECNATERNYPRDSCVHELIEAQALRSPGAIALRSARESLTYEELNTRANQLARTLQNYGVGPEVLVGVFLEPSTDLLVALLGIWKAGGAYVPLDPAYPRERLAFMMRDSAMRVAVTREKLRAALPAAGAEIVFVDRAFAHSADAENLQSGVRAENLAYVIYTSGSTGTPKGVMVPHRGLTNYLTWAAEAYNVAAGEGAPVHSSISFDLTITGLFTPLLVGRCVHILPNEQSLDTLAHVLQKDANFSLIKITPAHLDLLCAQVKTRDVASATRMFVVGGEALFDRSVEFWQSCAPDTVLLNEYGPTETVVGCCVYFVPRGKRFDGAIPIGRPIANTQLYVLDAQLRPVPFGETGELYIGGDGVARGYLNQPELTAQQFIPNPFAAEGSSAMMYKSGDLVRYLADGNLEYVGRVDDQIKIRSYRIEPGEIEAALLTHPHVRQAVVVARTNASGDRQLLAYIIPESDAPASSELRQHLKDRLPAYMLPAAFACVARFPLTQNGKIDRAALPEVEPAANGAPPRVVRGTDIEEQVAQFWSDALQASVALDDNFFDLGGDSLLAVRLVAQINQALGTQLDALTFYQKPTVRQLARVLEKNRQGASAARLVQVRVGASGASVFFLNAPLEFARLAALMGGDESFYISDVPFRQEVVRAAVRFEKSAYPSFDELIAPHVALILESGIDGPCFLAGYSSYGTVAFEVAHRLQAAGRKVDGIFLFDADMKAPLLKVAQVRCARHWRNTIAYGPAYLWKMAHGRISRGKETRAEIASARKTATPDAALSNGDISWVVFERIWIHALRHYRPRPLDTHGVLFRADISIYNELRDYDGCLGWRGLFDRGLTIVDVPGDHVSIWKEPDAVALSEAWDRCLQTLRRSASAVLCSAPTLLAALVCSV